LRWWSRVVDFAASGMLLPMKQVVAMLMLCALPFATLATEEAKDVFLPTKDARIEGPDAKYDDGAEFKCVRNWKSTNIVLRWSFNVPAKAAYRIFVTYAAPYDGEGCEAEVATGSQIARFTVRATGDWRKFEERDLGPILLRQPGPAELSVRVTKKMGGSVWDFRSLRLVQEK
jgi:hypothetical protein